MQNAPAGRCFVPCRAAAASTSRCSSPSQLTLPKRILYWTDHMIVDSQLDTTDAYLASLSKKMRYELRSKVAPPPRPPTPTPSWSTWCRPTRPMSWSGRWSPGRANASTRAGRRRSGRTILAWSGKLTELVRRRGRTRITRIDGRLAAISFLFPVGTVVYGLQTGFDPRVHLLLPRAPAQPRGHRGRHPHRPPADESALGPGAAKRRFGANPRRATKLSIFRTQTDRLFSLDEAWEVARRDLRRRGQRATSGVPAMPPGAALDAWASSPVTMTFGGLKNGWHVWSTEGAS